MDEWGLPQSWSRCSGESCDELSRQLCSPLREEPGVDDDGGVEGDEDDDDDDDEDDGGGDENDEDGDDMEELGEGQI